MKERRTIAGHLLQVLAVSFFLALTIAPAVHAVEAQSKNDSGYGVQPGDVLSVSVWKEDDLKSDVLVRPDGGISFPLAGDLQVKDKTVEQIRQELVEKIKKYIPDPVVTVAVKAIQGNNIYVIGKVAKPGAFVLNQPIDVMQALSIAGGTTTFAALNDIEILRRENGKQIAIPFRYGDVESGKHLKQNILLRNGDVVVVP